VNPKNREQSLQFDSQARTDSLGVKFFRMKTVAIWSVVMVCVAAGLSTPQLDSPKEQPRKAVCEAAIPKLRESGTSKIALIMTIDANGRVESFNTESPKGLRLEKMREAATAIKAMRFEPATKDGSPVRVQIRTEFKCVDDLRSAQDEAVHDSPQGIVGDIPGGLPQDGTSAIGGILSSEPQLPRVASPTHIRVAQGVMRSFLVTKVNPNYPPEAQRQHVDGMVLLHIDIDNSGNVSKVEPVSRHPLLIPAAIDAVKQWKYKPYLLNQKPVEVETTVPIKFVISGGNAYSIIAFASPKAISLGR